MRLERGLDSGHQIPFGFLHRRAHRGVERGYHVGCELGRFLGGEAVAEAPVLITERADSGARLGVCS